MNQLFIQRKPKPTPAVTNNAVDTLETYEHSIIITQSATVPTFGSNFQVDIRENNVCIKDCVLQLNVNAIVGTGVGGTAVTNYPNLASSFSWIEKYELLINGQVIDTRYDKEQFMLANMFSEDEIRSIENTQSGDYKSVAKRSAFNVDNQLWYIPLKSALTQAQYNILNQNHYITFRIFLKPLSSIINLSTVTGTFNVQINSANIISRVSRYTEQSVSRLITSLTQGVSRRYGFLELKQMTLTANSGSTTFSQVLSGITGRVVMIAFVVQKSTELTGDKCLTSQKLVNFELLDSSGKNIHGGQVQTHELNKNMMKYWSNSSYTTETDQNPYVWCFSRFPERSVRLADSQGYRVFQGNEQFKATFTESSSIKQIFVYALCEGLIEQKWGTVMKITT